MTFYRVLRGSFMVIVGHPEVYIIFVPAVGMVGTIVSTFSKRPLFGYTALVLSLGSIAFIGSITC